MAPTVPVFKQQLVVALQQRLYLHRVIVREVERQMVLEMKEERMWQVLVSADGRG